MIAGNRVRQAVRLLMQGIGRVVHVRSRESGEESLVFAVSNCHPTRVALYAAAFHGGWKIEFMKSLRDVVDACRSRRPRVVLYDPLVGGPPWNAGCASLAGEGVPFILLARRISDETFMNLIACGGYHASGASLNSEDILKAVDLAEEVAGLVRAPVE